MVFPELWDKSNRPRTAVKMCLEYLCGKAKHEYVRVLRGAHGSGGLQKYVQDYMLRREPGQARRLRVTEQPRGPEQCSKSAPKYLCGKARHEQVTSVRAALRDGGAGYVEDNMSWLGSADTGVQNARTALSTARCKPRTIPADMVARSNLQVRTRLSSSGWVLD